MQAAGPHLQPRPPLAANICRGLPTTTVLLPSCLALGVRSGPVATCLEEEPHELHQVCVVTPLAVNRGMGYLWLLARATVRWRLLVSRGAQLASVTCERHFGACQLVWYRLVSHMAANDVW